MTAYVAISPLNDHPIRIICRPCQLEQPAQRWTDALDSVKAHNTQHHGKGAA